jgi:hypothetical protein
VRRRLIGRVRLLVPLLIVNAAAVYGQVAYAFGEIAPPGWPGAARLGLAVLFAAAVESVAVYVGWHAHDALLAGATATAARLRRASYAIAAAVAGVNYAHFAGPGMTPSAAAVAFGLLSLLSPWLWGLHTRRVQHVQLRDAGAVDGIGATFSAERVRAFPIRSWAARRWSIDHNISDPVAAWAGYNAARAARRAAVPAGRWATAWAVLRGTVPTAATVAGTRPAPALAGTGDPVRAAEDSGTGTSGPVRRAGHRERRRDGTRTDAALLTALAGVPREPDGTVPVRRAAAALGTGPDRARRLLADAGLLRTAAIAATSAPPVPADPPPGALVPVTT